MSEWVEVAAGDDMSISIVEHFPNEWCGYACELGALDGVEQSETLGMESIGWEVLCIEPNPDVQQRLKASRKLSLWVACGASNQDEVSFGVCNPPASGSSFSDPEHPVRSIKAFPKYQPVKYNSVSVRTLDWCLEEVKFPRLDALVLDVEGWEPEVMAGFDVKRWNPAVLLVENWEPDTTWLAELLPSAWKFHWRREYNDIWINPERLREIHVGKVEERVRS